MSSANALPADPLVRAAYLICRAGTWFGGGLFILAALVVAVEVVIRKVFTLSIGGADELSGYALAVASAWAYGFALLGRAHVRIDTLYVILPVRLAAVLDLLGVAFFLVFFALVWWHGLGVLLQTVEVGSRSMTPLQTPLAIPQALWVAGLSTVVATAAILLVRAGILFVTGDLAALRRLVGSKSSYEEVAEEVEVQREASSPAVRLSPVASGSAAE